jgi:hypothetical protein
VKPLHLARPSAWTGPACSLALLLFAGIASAAIPFDSATVTVVHNTVTVGKSDSGQGSPARVSQVIRAKDYLSTGADSRAELTFEDSSIVRVGQNSVFQFDAASRTLSLRKGSMVLYVPPGNGGEIKTPSLTAAITGTIVKCGSEGNREVLAVIRGSLHTKWGTVPAGWAIEWVNGMIRIFRFDPAEMTNGKLYRLGNTPLPEDPEDFTYDNEPMLGQPDLHFFDLLDITQTNPNVNDAMDRPKKQPDAPKPPEDSPEEEPYSPYIP